jgi:methionyl-tRNA formyltransferase
MRVIFMGTPDFAVRALQGLIDSNHDVIAVYTREPKPKGRGMEMQKSPVHALADTYGIDVHTPKSLKKSVEEQAKFASLNADVAVVAAYGLLLPKAVLDAPKHGCLNIHGSLLPRWRGASPIQHAIWKGDDVSGVTIMQMDEGMDTGDMISKIEIPINSDTTAQGLFDDLSQLGGKAILDVLDNIETITPEKQNDALATHAPMLKKSDGEIDMNTMSAHQIDCQIRGLNPWPGTFVQGLKGRVKILKAHVEGDQIIFDHVQPEGKKAMDLKSAQNGGYF